MNAEQILNELAIKGFTIEAVGDRLKLTPDNLEAELLNRVREKRDEIRALLTSQPRGCAEPENLANLRSLCPVLWSMVQLDDSTEGLIWGVTCRGVIISRDPRMPLITVNPESIRVP